MDINHLVFFILFLFSPFVHSKKHSPTSYCNNNNKNLPIHYPFKLQKQMNTPNCSYITNLTCTNQGVATINLRNSGDFYVRHIDYTYSVIQLYDPDNCLPKRLMSFNLPLSYDLYPIGSIDYTFYGCPYDIIGLANLTAIDCLSNSTSAIVATHTVSSLVMTKIYRCNEIVTSSIPVSALDAYDFLGNQSDFYLRWFAPFCENCPHRTGLVSINAIAAAYMIMYTLTIILPPFICIACCAHFARMLRKDIAMNNTSNVR